MKKLICVMVVLFGLSLFAIAAPIEIGELDNSNLNISQLNRLLGVRVYKSEAITPGKCVVVAVIITANKPSEQQLNTFKNNIEKINGVESCEVPLYGKAPSADILPENSEIHAIVEGRFRIFDTTPILSEE